MRRVECRPRPRPYSRPVFRLPLPAAFIIIFPSLRVEESSIGMHWHAPKIYSPPRERERERERERRWQDYLSTAFRALDVHAPHIRVRPAVSVYAERENDDFHNSQLVKCCFGFSSARGMKRDGKRIH
jgi:hypothetical protein